MMAYKHQSGEGIRKGDRVLFHRTLAQIACLASEPGDPGTDWYVRDFGGGIMIPDAVAGHAFLSASHIEDEEDFDFLSRGDVPREKYG